MDIFNTDDVMVSAGSFWDDLQQDCVDAADEVGQATNWVYNTVAERGLPEPVADEVGDFVGGFVEDHWADVCNLPDTIADAFSDVPQEDN